MKPFDTGTDRFDLTGEVETQNGGQGLAGVRRRALENLDIERIHATGLDTDQNLTRLRGRLRDGTDAQRTTPGLRDGGEHQLG
jgi:hypothetical protein